MEFDGDWKPSPMSSIRKGQYRKGFIEYEVAMLPGVQAAIDHYTFEIATKAEEDLKQHHEMSRLDALRKLRGDSQFPADELMLNPAYIDIEDAGTDRLVSLNDERGMAAAMSIEYGHGAYRVLRADGTKYDVPESQPTWILHNASNLPKKGRKNTVPRVVLQKKRRKR